MRLHHTLKYPKKLGISKREVIKQRGTLGYPKAWELSEDKKNYYLKSSKASIYREIEAKKAREANQVFNEHGNDNIFDWRNML